MHAPSVEQSAPSAVYDRAARFSAIFAAKLLHQQQVPRVTWRDRPGALGHVSPMETVTTASGEIPEGGTIYLSPSLLTLERLPETVAHETVHLTHHRMWNPGGRAWQEREANEFGLRWGGTLLAAGKSVRWDPSRVSLIYESHPDQLEAWQLQGMRAGDVVISRRSCDAWRFDGSDWSALYA